MSRKLIVRYVELALAILGAEVRARREAAFRKAWNRSNHKENACSAD